MENQPPKRRKNLGTRSPLGEIGTALSFRDPDADGRMTCAQARVRDEYGKWQCRRFPVTSWRRDGTPIVPQAAIDWAGMVKRQFNRGEAVAGTATFQDFATALVENLEAAGVGSGRLDLIRNVAKALEDAGICEMNRDTFATRVRSWITGLRVGWSMAEDAPTRWKTDRPLSNASRNKLLIIARQVTGLAVRRRRLAHDPLAELPRFKEAAFLKPLFTIAELRHMVSDEARDRTASQQADLEAEIANYGGARTAAIKAIAQARGVHWSSLYHLLNRPPEADPWWLAACILAYTGCRADEGIHLRWEWIRWDARVITLKLADDFNSKTDAERLIPLEPELADILRPLAKPAGHILPPEIRAGGSGLRVREVAKTGKGARDYTGALRLYLARIGLDAKDRTAHSLRHCFISMKLAAPGTNVERLRKAVGHADFSTTMGYGKCSQLFEAEVDTWPDSTLWLRRPIPATAAREAR